MGAMAEGLSELGISADFERLAAERLPNGSVIARDLAGGVSIAVLPLDSQDVPPELAGRAGAFELGDLPRSVMLTNLGHVLRTPLNAVVGYGALLRELAEDEGSAEAQADAERIVEAGHVLTEVIDALSEAWRVEVGEQEPELELFDLAALLREVAAEVEPRVAAASQILLYDCPPVLSVFSDLTVMSAVLRLGLKRAVSRAVGEVGLKAYIKGEWLHLHVRDDGPIMSAEDLQAAFQVFARTDDAGVGQAAAGVRMATARELIRQMGGAMTLTNRSGEGTRLSVRLRA